MIITMKIFTARVENRSFHLWKEKWNYIYFFYFKGMGFVDLLYLKINKIFTIPDKVPNLPDNKISRGFYYY